MHGTCCTCYWYRLFMVIGRLITGCLVQVVTVVWCRLIGTGLQQYISQ
jgi:hypothetical protein